MRRRVFFIVLLITVFCLMFASCDGGNGSATGNIPSSDSQTEQSGNLSDSQNSDSENVLQKEEQNDSEQENDEQTDNEDDKESDAGDEQPESGEEWTEEKDIAFAKEHIDEIVEKLGNILKWSAQRLTGSTAVSKEVKAFYLTLGENSSIIDTISVVQIIETESGEFLQYIIITFPVKIDLTYKSIFEGDLDCDKTWFNKNCKVARIYTKDLYSGQVNKEYYKDIAHIVCGELYQKGYIDIEDYTQAEWITWEMNGSNLSMCSIRIIYYNGKKIQEFSLFTYPAYPLGDLDYAINNYFIGKEPGKDYDRISGSTTIPEKGWCRVISGYNDWGCASYALPDNAIVLSELKNQD